MLLKSKTRACDGLAKIVLVDLDADEIDAQQRARDRAAAQAEERIRHLLQTRGAVQPEAVCRQAPRERGRVRALLVAALNRFVGEKPRVAATAQVGAGAFPARDVRLVLVLHPDGAAIDRGMA